MCLQLATHARTHTRTDTQAWQECAPSRSPLAEAGAQALSRRRPAARELGAWVRSSGWPLFPTLTQEKVRQGVTHRDHGTDTPTRGEGPCLPLLGRFCWFWWEGRSGQGFVTHQDASEDQAALPASWADLPPSNSTNAQSGKSLPLPLKSRLWSFQPPGPRHWSEVWVVLLRACPPTLAAVPPRHGRCQGPGCPASLPWFRCCRLPRGRWCGGRGQRLHRLGRNWEDSTGRAGAGRGEGEGWQQAPTSSTSS